MAPKCPKAGCEGPARRVYAQVTSPKTKRSTTVTLPAIWCGELTTQTVGGRVVGTFATPTGKKGGHGFVEIPLDVFQVARRESVRLTTSRHSAWKGLPAPAPKAHKKAAKAPSAARKPRAAPKAKPKARRAGRAVSVAPAAPAEPAPMAAAPATDAPKTDGWGNPIPAASGGT